MLRYMRLPDMLLLLLLCFAPVVDLLLRTISLLSNLLDPGIELVTV